MYYLKGVVRYRVYVFIAEILESKRSIFPRKMTTKIALDYLNHVYDIKTHAGEMKTKLGLDEIKRISDIQTYTPGKFNELKGPSGRNGPVGPVGPIGQSQMYIPYKPMVSEKAESNDGDPPEIQLIYQRIWNLLLQGPLSYYNPHLAILARWYAWKIYTNPNTQEIILEFIQWDISLQTRMPLLQNSAFWIHQPAREETSFRLDIQEKVSMVCRKLSLNSVLDNLTCVLLHPQTHNAATDGINMRIGQNLLNDSDCEGVVAHELGHVLHNDCVNHAIVSHLYGPTSSLVRDYRHFYEGRADMMAVLVHPRYSRQLQCHLRKVNEASSESHPSCADRLDLIYSIHRRIYPHSLFS